MHPRQCPNPLPALICSTMGRTIIIPLLQMRKQLVSDKTGIEFLAVCLCDSPLPSNTVLLKGVCVCVCVCVCVWQPEGSDSSVSQG